MSTKIDVQPKDDRELVIARILDIPAAKAFQGWTDPKLMVQWYCPKPWYIDNVKTDVRAGGSSSMTMHGPNGEVMPLQGVYLEVIPNKKIVFTDAFTKAWEPSGCAFMVASVEFEDLGNGKCKYIARAHHWTKEAFEQHKQMGFEQGWGICADQLEALMKSL